MEYSINTPNGRLVIGKDVFVIIPGFTTPVPFKLVGVNVNMNGAHEATICGEDENANKVIRISALYDTYENASKTMVAEKARRELEKFDVWYAFGPESEYNELGNLESHPAIGIRSAQDVKSVNTMWMVAGDVYDKSGERVTRTATLANMNPEDISVKIRVQGIINGEIVQVPVGSYKCIENRWDGGNNYFGGRGYLTLTI